MTVGLDSRCHIDLSGIVEEVKAQYDAIAARSLEEAEAYSRSQVRDWPCKEGQEGRDRRWLRPCGSGPQDSLRSSREHMQGVL